MYCHARPRRPDFLRVRFAFDGRTKLYDDGRLFDVLADPAEESPLDPSDVEAPVLARLRDALDAMPPEPEHLRR